MTQEDQDAVIGRVVRERRELQAKEAALESEAQSIGFMFANLGAALQANPESIVFENHPAPSELMGRVPLYKQADLNGQRILTLVDELRATKRALSNIEAQARKFGI